MNESPEVDLATAEAERATWVRVRSDLTSAMTAATSELEYWDGVIEDLKKDAAK